MAIFKTVYKCRECGATSYQPVMDRAANGALQPTGAYKCTGCRNVFASLVGAAPPGGISGFPGQPIQQPGQRDRALIAVPSGWRAA